MAEAEEEITKDVVENRSTKTDKEEEKVNKTKKTARETTKTTKAWTIVFPVSFV